MSDIKKITAALASAASAVRPAGDLDLAAFKRIAQAMNQPYKIGRGQLAPEYAAACRAFHGAPHMTGPGVADLLGLDYEAARPAPAKFTF